MNIVACNLHKWTLTGGVAITLTANSGQSATHIGPTVLIEKENESKTGQVIVLNDQGGCHEHIG